MISGLALFIGLFNNLALLIILVAVYGFLRDRLRRLGRAKRQLALGLMFSLFVVGCMQVKIPVFAGVLVDQRNAIVIMAGAFGGPLAAALAMAAGATYRILLGGQGVLGGVLGLLLSCVAGSVLHARRGRIDAAWKAALAALAAAAFILPGFLPIGSPREGWELMKAMALPYGSAIAVGIFVGSLLLANEERRCDAQAALRDSERKYRDLFESLIDLSYRTEADGRIGIVSPSSRGILGYLPEEIAGKPIAGLYRDASRHAELADRIGRSGAVENYEAEMVRKDGEVIVMSTNARVIRDSAGRFAGIEGVSRDITPLKRAEDGLRAALGEREALLMELYHRANNNMQVISSFLRLQAEALGGAKVEALAQGMASRIHAMSLVYEKLYKAGSLSQISAKEYIEDLIPLVEGRGDLPKGKVGVELDVEDTRLVIDTAIPLGLVINEIVENAFKHAFPGARTGRVRLSLRRRDAESILLEISDDGAGLPPGLDPETTPSFGISTMLSLVRQQLRGTVEIGRESGLSYRIAIKDRLYEERV